MGDWLDKDCPDCGHPLYSEEHYADCEIDDWDEDDDWEDEEADVNDYKGG